MQVKPKLLSFYLPQYHPIPENDKWWGPGFTEWRNVAGASPLFKGHYQPHQPADFGFYDLRLPEVRDQQARIARQYGIDGFCYYHYWFSGKQLLERPVLEILNSGQPDFPFCLCWANENWTRRWDGLDKEILVEQQYSLNDDSDHFNSLLPYFQDPRYIRINNKPVFIVYRASLLPDPLATTNLWRKLAQQNSLAGIYLVKVESFAKERSRVPALDGFDAALDFQPDWRLPRKKQPSTLWKILNKVGLAHPHIFKTNNVYTYSDLVTKNLSRPSVDYPRFPCVTPGWDNTSRRQQGGAGIVMDSTPNLYQQWLEAVLEDSTWRKTVPEPIVFINAWNEWAEGNHLEPDLRWGYAYLEATKRALGK